MTETVQFFSPGQDAELRSILDGFRPFAAAWNGQPETTSSTPPKAADSAAQH